MSNADLRPYRLSASASHLLHRAEQMAADRFAQLAGGVVTLRQFAVLATIAEHPGISQTALVRATGIDRSTLADMLTRLQRRGLIERRKSETDARLRAIQLTPAGLGAYYANLRHARAADAAILGMLPRTKARALQAILTKLAKLAEEAAQKAERAAQKEAKRLTRAKRRAKHKGERTRKSRARRPAKRRKRN